MLGQLKKYKTLLSIGLLIVLSPIIVYILAFHDMKWGKPSDFAEFATYFNNMLMPFLTLGTVIALVLTLKHQKQQLDEQRDQFKLQIDEQREQFQKQMKSAYFESYVQRFETQFDRNSLLCLKEFPCEWNSSRSSRFNLKEVALTSNQDPKYKYIQETLSLIEKVRDIDEKELQNDVWKRTKIYTEEIKSLVESSAYTLFAVYTFAENKNALILLDLMEKAANMIYEIYSWKIISLTDYLELLLSLIHI